MQTEKIIGFKAPEELRQKVAEAAQKEYRSVSSFMKKITAEAVGFKQ